MTHDEIQQQKERISENPLNWGDMTSFLLRIAKYETDCEAIQDELRRISVISRKLLTKIHEDGTGRFWNEITEALICDERAEAQAKLCKKYNAYQIVDMTQEIVQVLFGYFNIRECFDALRLMEEYEGGATA